MYTDGFMEQIGGTDEMPMNYKQFEKVLIETASINNKENNLTKEFNRWKGKNETVDDVLIMGFQV